MADDPIEKLSAELEIYGIPQADGAPPMTTTYLHVRRRQDGAAGRAVMGLPAYEGKQGPAGPPGAVHQGERTTAELEALATVLGRDHTNWAYRNTDTDDQYVWSGETWVIYHQVYATPGPVGPAPTLQPGDLTVAGEEVDGEFGVRVAGSQGSYAIGLDLPELPPGEPGEPGPPGRILESTDIEEGSTPAQGRTLVFNEATGKVRWEPAVAVEQYGVGSSSFPNIADIPAAETRRNLVSLVIAARDYPYRLDFGGNVDVRSAKDHLVDLEIRQGDPATGPLVAVGRGTEVDGWFPNVIQPYQESDFDPASESGVIAPGTEVTLHLTARKQYGSSGTWAVRNERAHLRVRLVRVV